MPDSYFDEFKTEYLAIHPPALDTLNRLAAPTRGLLPKALVSDPDQYPCYLQKQGSSAVIHINGFLSYKSYWMGTNVQVAARDFKDALQDKDVDTIILHIDSPGGVLTGIAEFAQMVYEARGQKRIVGYAQGMCASAALWIFSACGIRITNNIALLGSVGVMFQFEDDSEYRENQGFKTYTVISKQSPKKQISPATGEGQKSYQVLADKIADEFIDSVAMYTGISAESVQKDFGQGFLLVGKDAVKVGMADEVGTIADVLNGNLTTFDNQPKGEAMAKENEATPNAEEGTTTPAAEENKTTPAAEQSTEKTDPPAKTTEAEQPATTLEGLGKQVTGLMTMNEKILGTVEKVVDENQTIKAENEDLKKTIETLKAENDKLGEQPDEEETPKANGLSDGIERGY